MRLDAYLIRKHSELSRSAIATDIQKGLVQVNGTVCTKKSYSVSDSDSIVYTPSEKPEWKMEAIPMDLHIVQETDSWLLLSKPAGISVHPSETERGATIAHGLMYYTQSLSHVSGEFRPGIVHRLDKDTSGLLMIAKNDVFHRYFSDLLQNRSIEKWYRARVHGKVESGIITAPIGRAPQNRLKMCVTASGKPAETHVYAVEYDVQHDTTLVDIRIITGRTHQIRVHMTSIGHPIVGDSLYGRKEGLAEKFWEQTHQALHAYRLVFTDQDGRKYDIVDTLPSILQTQASSKESVKSGNVS